MRALGVQIRILVYSFVRIYRNFTAVVVFLCTGLETHWRSPPSPLPLLFLFATVFPLATALRIADKPSPVSRQTVLAPRTTAHRVLRTILNRTEPLGLAAQPDHHPQMRCSLVRSAGEQACSF